VFRRRRLTTGAIALALLVGVVVVRTVHNASSRPSAPPPTSTVAGATTTGTAAAAPKAVTAAAAPWMLPSPVSRAAVFVDDGQLAVLGGLGPANTTTGSIVELNLTTGHGETIGKLAEPVHDAAGGTIGARLFVFGGGAQSVSAAVQMFNPDAPASAAPEGKRVGSLPSPRADVAATSVDGAIVLVGGYDGTHATPDVLVTTDGTTFTSVATLPVPVRYPAVAAIGHVVYVIGGEQVSGGGDADAIQAVDLQSRTARVIGHLPRGRSHAVAAVVDEVVYVYGGRIGGSAVSDVSALDPVAATLRTVGELPNAVSDASLATVGAVAYVVGGQGPDGHPVATITAVRLTPTAGSAPLATSGTSTPFDGQLLIADRGNNRLVVIDAAKAVHWSYPSAAAAPPPEGFYFPDDAFFVHGGSTIITNEEEQHTIIELAYPSGAVVARYGHPNQPGRSAGYLNQPDDAYVLKDGEVTVADAKNCRILFLHPDFTYDSQIGTTGRCRHDIPADVAYPNGDTPLADGNLLVSEINGSYVDEVTKDGHVLWTVRLPIAYPSDPQQIGPDLYLIADYSHPGGLYEFTREGQIVWSYQFSSGEQMLDHPSLAEILPSGLIAVNDDYRDRVVIIDPTSKQIVWQYGQTDIAGTGPGQLNTPDGFDLLAPDHSTPTHPQTG
jgi:hypothetical protein